MRNPFRPLRVAFVLWALAPAPALAQCIVEPPRLTEPAAYLGSVVSALSEVKEPSQEIAITAKATDNALNKAVEMFAQLPRIKRAFGCAALHVQGYAKSSIESVSGSAESLADAFQRLAALIDAQGAYLKEVLNRPPGAKDMGSHAERLAKLRETGNELWEKILLAIAMATHATRKSAGDGQGMVSAISTDDRLLLRKRLIDAFGVEIAAGLKAGQDHITVSAAILHEVLGQTLATKR